MRSVWRDDAIHRRVQDSLFELRLPAGLLRSVITRYAVLVERTSLSHEIPG